MPYLYTIIITIHSDFQPRIPKVVLVLCPSQGAQGRPVGRGLLCSCTLARPQLSSAPTFSPDSPGHPPQPRSAPTSHAVSSAQGHSQESQRPVPHTTLWLSAAPAGRQPRPSPGGLPAPQLLATPTHCQGPAPRAPPKGTEFLAVRESVREPAEQGTKSNCVQNCSSFQKGLSSHPGKNHHLWLHIFC